MDESLKVFTDRFTKLTDKELQDLAALFQPMNIKKKDHLFVEGDTIKNMYFVSKGILRGYCLKDGVDFTTNFIFGPGMFTDMLSIRTKQPTLLHLQLLNECEVYETKFTNIEEMAESNPRILFLFFKLYEGLFLYSKLREQSFIFDSAEERYLRLFQERPRVVAEIPQQYIASYLGIKPETLSRIRKRIF